jgi:hypothetical protein
VPRHLELLGELAARQKAITRQKAPGDDGVTELLVQLPAQARPALQV